MVRDLGVRILQDRTHERFCSLCFGSSAVLDTA
jgi:hypothetical protein